MLGSQGSLSFGNPGAWQIGGAMPLSASVTPASPRMSPVGSPLNSFVPPPGSGTPMMSQALPLVRAVAASPRKAISGGSYAAPVATPCVALVATTRLFSSSSSECIAASNAAMSIRRTSNISEVVRSGAEASIECCCMCSSVFPDGAVFCMHCGARRPVAKAVDYCDKCTCEMPAEAVFCMSCGEKRVVLQMQEPRQRTEQDAITQAMRKLQSENAEMRHRLEAQDVYAATDNRFELASDSTHLPGLEDERVEFETAFPIMMDDSQGATTDTIFHRLQRERVVLLCDLNSVKAKFELTLQTLRSAMRLDGDATTWADILERVTALTDGCLPSGGAEALEAELEVEQLEDKLESQSRDITRMRELLQKQQRLLDVTARQIHDHHQQNKGQDELQDETARQREERQQEIGDAQSSRIAALTERLREEEQQTSRLRLEFKMQRDLAAQLEEALDAEVQARHDSSIQKEAALKRHGDRIVELQEQLVTRDLDNKRHRADVERQKQVIKELTAGLAAQTQACDSMQAKTPEHNFRSCAFESSSRDRSNASGVSSGGPKSLRQDAGTPGSMDMEDTERDTFLSHFPIAQRTEQHIQNVESRSRAHAEKPHTPGSAYRHVRNPMQVESRKTIG